ncbi:MAG TPA: putative quinol monooxygenase [Chloroflexota bacterium]|jgi:autoinducer 2-degrading protein
MLGLVVSLRVKPEARERFLAGIKENAASSVRDEPGCLRFDVLEDQADPNHFLLYEIYRDDAAFEAHRQAPHFARWRQIAEEVLTEQGATRLAPRFPEEYR